VTGPGGQFSLASVRRREAIELNVLFISKLLNLCKFKETIQKIEISAKLSRLPKVFPGDSQVYRRIERK
jgi:hypothetical protein